MQKEKRCLWEVVEAFVQFCCKLASYIVPVLLIVIMLLVTLNVVMRQIFNSPINGTNEIVECIIAAAGFLSIGWATICGMHISVDIVTRKAKPLFSALLEAFTSLLSFCITPFLIYCSFEKAVTAFVKHDMSQVLKFQVYPVYFAMAIGYVLLLLAQFVVTVNNFRKVGHVNDRS